MPLEHRAVVAGQLRVRNDKHSKRIQEEEGSEAAKLRSPWQPETGLYAGLEANVPLMKAPGTRTARPTRSSHRIVARFWV